MITAVASVAARAFGQQRIRAIVAGFSLLVAARAGELEVLHVALVVEADGELLRRKNRGLGPVSVGDAPGGRSRSGAGCPSGVVLRPCVKRAMLGSLGAELGALETGVPASVAGASAPASVGSLADAAGVGPTSARADGLWPHSARHSASTQLNSSSQSDPRCAARAVRDIIAAP